MDNEIMTNEEVMETTEEIAKVGLSKGFKIGVGIGLAVLIGGVTYKYVVKPLVAKIKANKERQKIVEVDFNHSDDEEESEEI